ncbi:MAG: hypothetical protein IJJ26_00855 [Victivallales bacterium]|nr:hypothetical protein [Victivallales bacterium]
MSKYKRYLAGFVAAMCLCLMLQAAPPKQTNTARAEWMGGFVKMEAADKAAADNAVAALDLYKEALDIFLEVRRKYPQWNPSLLNYRVNYCQERIQALDRKMAGQANTLSANELLELTKKQARRIQELETSEKELQSRVSILGDGLQRARAEAAKGSTLETTTAQLAAAKTNLEKQIANLEMRLQDAQNRLNQAEKDSKAAKKLRSELEQTQKKLEASEQSLRKSRLQTDTDHDTIKKLNKQLASASEELAGFRRLAEKRKDELDSARQDTDNERTRKKEAERARKDAEAELARITKQLNARLNEVARLQKLRDADAETIEKLRKGQVDSSLSQKLQEELNNANARLQERQAAAADAEARLQLLQREHSTLRAQNLTRTEQNLEMTGRIANLQEKLASAETQNLRLNNQLQELRIILSKASDDARNSNAKVQDLEKKSEELETVKRRFEDQSELVRQQEKQIAKQNKEIVAMKESAAKAAKESENIAAELISLRERSAKAVKDYQDQIRQLRLSNEASVGMAKNLAEAEQRITDLENILKKSDSRTKPLEDQIRQLNATLVAREESLLEANSKAEQLQKGVAALREEIWKRKLDFMQKELQTEQHLRTIAQEELDKKTAIVQTFIKLHPSEYQNLNPTQDSAEKRTQTVLDARLQELKRDIGLRDQQIDSLHDKISERDRTIGELSLQLQNNASAQAWNEKLRAVNEKLQKETTRRKALENALLDMESRSIAATKLPPAQTTTPQATGAKPATADEPLDDPIAAERRRQALIKGFLRQGTDAERQQRLEAAQFNYKKVLELDADNLLALQRLGILASNLGNDLDAVKYLKLAYRFDPDDQDTLLALGYSQARLGQASWAVSNFSRAISLRPNDGTLARYFGAALMNLGWTQAAESELLRATTLNPEDVEAAYNLAVLYCTAKPPRLPEAKKWYHYALQHGAQPDPGLDRILK